MRQRRGHLFYSEFSASFDCITFDWSDDPEKRIFGAVKWEPTSLERAPRPRGQQRILIHDLGALRVSLLSTNGHWFSLCRLLRSDTFADFHFVALSEAETLFRPTLCSLRSSHFMSHCIKFIRLFVSLALSRSLSSHFSYWTFFALQDFKSWNLSFSIALRPSRAAFYGLNLTLTKIKLNKWVAAERGAMEWTR